MTVRFAVGLLALTLWYAAGCAPADSAKDAKSPPPATVAKPANEDDLATVVLTPKAEQRLGIQTVEAALKQVPRQRTLGGEVMFPPGQAIIISSPFSGALTVPEGATVPPPGSQVKQGQPIFSLLPLLAPEHTVLTTAEQAQLAQSRNALESSRIEAQQQAQSAQVEVEAEQIAMARAEQLLKDKAGSRQALDEARARLELAQKSLEAARARYAFLEKTRLEAEAGHLARQIIVAPATGVISNYTAVAGETVVAGKALFEVVNTDRMWIRVPIYVGQWREVDTALEVRVKEFGEPDHALGRPARPIAAPPSADPIAATIDMFYEMANVDGQLRPGHKVAVTLTLKGPKESLVIPWAAVLFDIYGGGWVYEEVGPQTFVRRRVEVEFVSGADAVLANGPEPGTKLVTDGATELFGTEFGFGK